MGREGMGKVRGRGDAVLTVMGLLKGRMGREEMVEEGEERVTKRWR